VVVETAAAARDGPLENSLCEIHPNQSIVHVDSSFCCDRQRLWHIDADQVAGGVHFINDPDERRVASVGGAGSSIRCYARYKSGEVKRAVVAAIGALVAAAAQPGDRRVEVREGSRSC
jgi:hypothetical protein